MTVAEFVYGSIQRRRTSAVMVKVVEAPAASGPLLHVTSFPVALQVMPSKRALERGSGSLSETRKPFESLGPLFSTVNLYGPSRLG